MFGVTRIDAKDLMSDTRCQTSCNTEGQVYLIVPAKVGCDNETDTQDAACDWMDAGLHCDGRDLVGTLFDR